MDTYLIKKDTITEIANNVRALMGTSEQLTTEGINNAIILEKESVDLALEMLANKGVEVPEGSRSDSLAELIQSLMVLVLLITPILNILVRWHLSLMTV